jgi:hypothetical protein
MLEIVRKAADRIGGVPKLAERLGVTRQAIYQWREVPAERVGEIALATGVPRADLRPDLFAIAQDLAIWQADAIADAEPAPPIDWSGLRCDELRWLEAQADAVAGSGLQVIDTDRLVHLLRSLADEARCDIERRMTVVLVRLLKWHYRPERRSLSTIAVITAERARILNRAATSPALRAHAETALHDVYKRAIAQTADETGLALDVFPVDCPLGLDELLDPAFALAARVA